MRFIVRASLLSPLLLLAIGCPAGNDKGVTVTNGGGAGSSGAPHSYAQYSLQQACAASCQAQAATNCPGVLAASDCTESCLEAQGMLHCNADVWRDLNACMATAALTCDRVNGGAAVSSEDCGAELDAFSKCL